MLWGRIWYSYKFSIDDVFIFRVSIYIVTAPITYFIVTKSHPKPKNETLETIDNNCKTCFLEGYEKGSLKRRKSSILFGYSVLPTALLSAFLLGAITQGKFPPELWIYDSTANHIITVIAVHCRKGTDRGLNEYL